nr:Dihydrofolate reductase [uncultured bacterium]
MISFIAAITKNHVMAKNGGLPWELKTDKEYYHAKVRGHIAIVGSTTFPQLNEGLTDREIIVLAHDLDYHPAGATVVHSVDEALKYTHTTEEIMVLGGGQVFKGMMPYADRMYLTEIDIELDGDVFFPEFDRSEWIETSREHHEKDKDNEYDFDFVVYDRRSKETA